MVMAIYEAWTDDKRGSVDEFSTGGRVEGDSGRHFDDGIAFDQDIAILSDAKKIFMDTTVAFWKRRQPSKVET